MSILSGLEPEKVFFYFEEIAGIPHGSGNVEQISNYLAAFAEKRGLFCIQDTVKNIIIVKEATKGYEQEPTVILQGHMDMVAVKKPDCELDMRTQGLQLAVDGDKIYAEGTSLGGDDGIAVAYALAILDSETIQHPRLEVIITVDEEVGMDGAREIDLSMLQGQRMINLDSEEEGIFLTSCAGGARVKNSLPLQKQEASGICLSVTIGGLQGGHSGGEIHKERGNSNCLFARLLWNLTRKCPVQLASAKGGLADNAIPRETKALFLIQPEWEKEFREIVQKTEQEIAEELSTKDPAFYMQVKAEKLPDRSPSAADAASQGAADTAFQDAADAAAPIISCQAVTVEDTRKAASYLLSLPNGVQAMSADISGLVETSLNLGILEITTEALYAEFAVRSSVESSKYSLIEKLAAVTGLAGGTYEVSGDYPGWKYRTNSPLRDKMIMLYEQMYGVKPKVEAIHAGLECGLLGSKIKNLDCVSFGPDMNDIHTTEETLSISSTKRVWEYLIRLLETKDEDILCH